MSDSLYRSVLLDTGPLVAILDRTDHSHSQCVSTLNRIEPPLLTCWAVLTEAAWLLRATPEALKSLLAAKDATFFRILDVPQEEFPEIRRLFDEYEDLCPQLADLTLFHLALREGLDTVFTLDRRDFTVFRRSNKQPFTLLPA